MKRLLFLSLIFVVMGCWYVQAIPLNESAGALATPFSAGGSGMHGINITANKNLYLLNASVGTGCTSVGRIYLYDASGNAMANATVNSGTGRANFTLSQNVSLRSGLTYILMADNNGGAYTACKRDPATLPSVNTNINFISDDTGDTTILRNIQIVTTVENITLSVALNSPLDGSTTGTGNVTFNATVSANFGSILNSTLFLWYNNGTVFVTNVTNINGTTNDSLFNIYSIPDGAYKWNVRGCVINSTGSRSCGFAGTNYSLFSGIIVNSQVYTNITASGANERFEINLTSGASSPTIATLFYNNTMYAGTILNVVGSNYSISTSITIPVVSTSTNKSFYWVVNLSSGTSFTSNSANQTVNTLSLDACTTFTQRLLNFSLLDEDTRTSLNGTIEVLAKLYTYGTTDLIGSFNNSYSVGGGSTAAVCIQAANATYRLDYQTKYYANSSYVIEYKYGQNITITNSSTAQIINLYDLLFARSTAFQIILQNPDLSVIQGAIIDVQRQYIPINSYLSVESPLTDSQGTAIAHLVLEDVYYTFVITKDGQILGTFNSNTVQCQNVVTGDCRINLNLIQANAQLPDFNSYGNVSINFNWLPSNRSLSLTFITTDNAIHTVGWNVTQANNYGNTTICNNALAGTTGTLTCSIPTSYGNTSIIAQIYIDGIYLGYNVFSLDQIPEDVFGGTRVILGLLMFSTLTLLFIGNPIALIIGGVLGMGATFLFHLSDGGTFIGNGSILLWYIVAGFILFNYMRNKR